MINNSFYFCVANVIEIIELCKIINLISIAFNVYFNLKNKMNFTP